MAKLFILDLDGTLVDSKFAHINSFKRPLNSRGLYTDARELSKYLGLQEEEILLNIFPYLKKRALTSIMNDKRKRFIKSLNLVKRKRCAVRLLRKLNSLGAVVIATNCHLSEVKPLIEHFNWGIYFKKLYSSYESARPKPAPDLLIKIIKDLRFSKEDVLYIGDTVYDAFSAQSAGIKFIGLANSSQSFNEFKSLGVSEVHKDLCSLTSSF